MGVALVKGYRMSQELKIGSVGPCLLHGEYHVLGLKCWAKLRQFLHACEIAGRTDPSKNMNTYKAAVDQKIKDKRR